jgi:hypothetical protein
MLQSPLQDLAGPLLTALVAAIGVVLKDWQQKRSRHQRHSQVLAGAAERIGFIRSWYETASQVADCEELTRAKQRAHDSLEEAYGALNEALTISHQESATRDIGLLRRMLLAYELPSLAARRARRVFHVYLGVWILLVPAGFYDDPTMSGWDEIYTTILMIAAFALPLFFIHMFATSKSKDAGSRTSERDAPTAQYRGEVGDIDPSYEGSGFGHAAELGQSDTDRRHRLMPRSVH